MLVNLHVKNMAIIDDIDVSLGNKLNILTGETGAGKSIIIDSINFALGGKLNRGMLKDNTDNALVELLFSVDNPFIISLIKDKGFEIEDNEVLISRKIMNGKSISKLNGETIASNTLREISEFLIDIHGQHEHQSLLNKTKHMEILDEFCKDSIVDYHRQLEELFDKLKEAENSLAQIDIDIEKRNREVSFLEYEIQEIENAKLKNNEDEEIEQQYKKMKNSQKIVEAAGLAYEATEGNGEGGRNAVALISTAIRELHRAVPYDYTIHDMCEQLETAEDILNEFNRRICSYIESMEFDEKRFVEVEQRLDIINLLKSKYGNSIEAIYEYKDSQQERLEAIQNSEVLIKQLKGQIEDIDAKINIICEKITDIRRTKSMEISQKIKNALEELNFQYVEFEIGLSKLNKPTRKGIDDVEFLISTNKGQPIRELGKVASGGELSRIMLAIKSVLAQNDGIDTLIFDEIDVGISGRTAQRVAERLVDISRTRQVICITHLPQIAAMADTHFLIEKEYIDNETKTDIKSIKDDASIRELARLIGGVEITQTVLDSANEMKQMADKIKK